MTFSLLDKMQEEAIFENLIYAPFNRVHKLYYLSYIAEKEWLLQPGVDFGSFTGFVKGTDINGEVISMATIKQGRSVIEENAGSRMMTKTPPMPEEEGCYQLELGPVTGEYFWVDVPCGYTGGGGGGPAPDGGSPSGGENPSDDSPSDDSTDGGDPYNGYEDKYDDNDGGEYYDGTGSGGGGSGDSVDDDEPKDKYAGVSIEEFFAAQLEAALEEDPYALIDISCEELRGKWAGLAEHKPEQEVLNRIDSLNQKGYEIEVQYLEDAAGTVVNMDYFPVEITQLPRNPATGKTYTGEEFFNHIRKNFAEICFSDNSSFGAYNQSEAKKWNSSNYLGTLMRFDIALMDPAFGVVQIGQQDGSVICSDQQAQSWIFSTVYSDEDYSHPVSGNREFGLTANSDGSYTFFTRGVDRIAESTDVDAGELMGYTAFDGGEELWANLQQNLTAFVNNPANGGKAAVEVPTVERTDNATLQAVLDGTMSVSELGCDD